MKWNWKRVNWELAETEREWTETEREWTESKLKLKESELRVSWNWKRVNREKNIFNECLYKNENVYLILFFEVNMIAIREKAT